MLRSPRLQEAACITDLASALQVFPMLLSAKVVCTDMIDSCHQFSFWGYVPMWPDPTTVLDSGTHTASLPGARGTRHVPTAQGWGSKCAPCNPTEGSGAGVPRPPDGPPCLFPSLTLLDFLHCKERPRSPQAFWRVTELEGVMGHWTQTKKAWQKSRLGQKKVREPWNG